VNPPTQPQKGKYMTRDDYIKQRRALRPWQELERQATPWQSRRSKPDPAYADHSKGLDPAYADHSRIGGHTR